MAKNKSLTVPKKRKKERGAVVIQGDVSEYHDVGILKNTSSYLFARAVETNEVTGALHSNKAQLAENFLRELGVRIIALQSESETTSQSICNWVQNDSLLKIRRRLKGQHHLTAVIWIEV